MEWRGPELRAADGRVLGRIWTTSGVWYAAIRFNEGHGRVAEASDEGHAKRWVEGQIDKENSWP